MRKQSYTHTVAHTMCGQETMILGPKMKKRLYYDQKLKSFQILTKHCKK